MEFGSGILGSEAPIDGGLAGVASDLIRVDSAGQGHGDAVASAEAVSGQDAEFDFRHVEPTGVFGSVMKLQAFRDASGLGGGKGLVERGHAVDVQVVQDYADYRGVGIGVFITLQPPTEPMRQEALSAGIYTPEHFPDQQHPRVQILTIDELLAGQTVAYPRGGAPATFRQAPRRRRSQGRQNTLV